MAITANVLGNVATELKRGPILGDIFDKAAEGSAVMSLARRVPLGLDAATTITVNGDIPIAGWTAEGARKPIGGASTSTLSMTGKKIALIVPVSEELARTNAGGLYDQLRQDLPRSLALAFDAAAIHGVDLRSGGAGPFASYLTQTTKAVQLGTAAQNKGGIYADLVGGEALVTNDDFDFSGYVADPRLAPTLKLATDLNGRPLFLPEGSAAGSGVAVQGDLAGYPIAYSRAVSRKLRRVANTTDTRLRAIGGDWSQAVYGVGMDLKIDVSTEGVYVDGDGTVHSAFQENLVLLRVEAYYGFLIADTAAFVKYSVAAPTA